LFVNVRRVFLCRRGPIVTCGKVEWQEERDRREGAVSSGFGAHRKTIPTTDGYANRVLLIGPLQPLPRANSKNRLRLRANGARVGFFSTTVVEEFRGAPDTPEGFTDEKRASKTP